MIFQTNISYFRHPELVSGSDWRENFEEILKQVQDDEIYI